MNAFIASSLSDEPTQREVLGRIAQITVSIASFSLLNAALGIALWAWLAMLIAAVLSWFAGDRANAYMRGTGYDHAVNAVASVRLFFAKKVAA
jgi:uncharacterized membrane protein YdbT with pleckstrin-like domain